MAIEFHKMDSRTIDWHKERQKRLGSSDVGTVLGLNPYCHPVKLFYEKIDPQPTIIEDNAPMFWGRELEDKVAEIWRYWDGTADGYIKNRNEENVIRKCRRSNGMIINTRYPWLAINNDRVATKGQINMIDGKILDYNFPIECKTINQAEMSKWEAGVPPQYLAQVTTQMIVMDVDYGEIAVFDNYRNFLVIPVKLDKEFAEYLLQITREFFYDRVELARPIVRKVGYLDYGNLPPELQALEPPADDGSDAYKQFWSEKMKGKEMEEVIVATPEMHTHAEMMKYFKAMSKSVEDKAGYHRNKLVEFMQREKAEKIDLGSMGSCTWKATKSSAGLVFNNRSKYEFDPLIFQDMLSDIPEEHRYTKS